MILRAWPLFVDSVRRGRTITYSELAARVGPPVTRRQVHRALLSPLSERCREAGLPALAALVVRKDTGMPGGGWDGESTRGDPRRAWAEELAAVFAHPWGARPDPRLLRGAKPAKSARSPKKR